MSTYDPGQYPTGQPTPQYPQGQGAPTGQPMGYVGQQSTEKNNLGAWALGLGIAALACCGLFTGIPAIILGIMGVQAANQGRASNKGLAIAGIVLGVLSIIWTFVVFNLGLYDQFLQ
ncbi:MULTISPECIES: DUF4190 domain-containing protein [Actinomyces]|uniref:DUF4190 domain-containing protein n=1 Tax=Actinomyces respiraculi TaxID=2744574 RepID=A0A7T0LIR2_9ACTO|nr:MULTISPECIES: DUF4190 domain-containing protein [Actinomyces]QPL04501.1 DUF4190 domain-containing protein [Actinomyces respiraculi]